MFNIPLATTSVEILPAQFWNSVVIYFNRPHLVNRKLSGIVSTVLVNVNYNNLSVGLTDVITPSAILYEVQKLKELSKEYVGKEFLQNILEPYDKNVKLCNASVDDFIKSMDEIFISLRILLPRQENVGKCIEIVVLNKKNNVATFFAPAEANRKTLAPSFPYEIQHFSGNLRICIKDFDNAESSSADWLCRKLFSKLVNWANNFEADVTITESLSLICIETYTKLYHELKNKYSKKMIQIWQENTDPLKYVYEDIAIASYLIALWQQTNSNRKPSFVDLGCGNGLLVYILNEEGYTGFGIDVRKRKIWDWYPKTTILNVETITPSAKSLFPEVDWIIGNHSDELTPWIPVITARSSYKTNFFLLPCCCYEFSGCKYKRTNTAISTYSEYLLYVEDICKKCGFIFKKDKLRIPSTKRTCVVSLGRNYEPCTWNEVNNRITLLINKHCQINEVEKDVWLPNVQTRSNVEKVRNCTQINQNVISKIINEICALLLSEQNFLTKYDAGLWNAGGSFLISNIAKIIDKEDLKMLKKEYGGLQTLIKNHRYIFEVSKSAVRFRIPLTLEMVGDKYKNKPCWFYKYHNHGCLHSNQKCAYKHDN